MNLRKFKLRGLFYSVTTAKLLITQKKGNAEKGKTRQEKEFK